MILTEIEISSAIALDIYSNEDLAESAVYYAKKCSRLESEIGKLNRRKCETCTHYCYDGFTTWTCEKLDGTLEYMELPPYFGCNEYEYGVS